MQTSKFYPTAQPRYNVINQRHQPPLRKIQRLSIRAEALKDKKEETKAPDTALGKQKPSPSPTKPPEPQAPTGKKPFPVEYNRSWTSIFLDKIVDSADDISKHIRRLVLDLPTTTTLQRLTRRGDAYVLESKKPLLLILGSGWGAHSLIKVVDTEKFDVVCVSPCNHFLFTPMLPSTAVGTVEFRSLLEPVRVANPYVSYFEAECSGVDFEKKVAFCTSNITDLEGERRKFEVAYDVLFVAVGEKPATFSVPGVEENCYFMKEVKDAVRLRTRIQQVFELASLPGPTGVEFAGTLSDFLRQDLKKKYPELMKYVKVTLLQSQQNILTQFDSGLAERALENFAKTGVEVRTGVRVVEVTASDVVLSSGERIPHGVCVWSAGNAPRSLIQDIARSIPEQAEHTALGGKQLNKLAVDPFLRVIGAKDVVAVGDCASFILDPLPPTAQVAGQQGAYVAHVINRGYTLGVGGMEALPPFKKAEEMTLADRAFATLDTLNSGENFGSIDDTNNDFMPNNDGKPTATAMKRVGGGKVAERLLLKKPFEFLSLGLMASIGNDKALMQIEVLDSKLKVSGDLAFLLWKSVYITKQVSFRNRVLILFDWVKTRVFGRDLSQF